MNKEKEYLYIGHYEDTRGKKIIKVGTTNNIKRRTTEHNRNYRRNQHYKMPNDKSFIMDCSIPLSKANTLKYEESIKEDLRNQQVGVYIPNDRFICDELPETITIKIKKEYIIKFIED